MSSLAPSIGQTLGHYRILEQIGAGGMGVVYQAYDTKLERNVALKVLPSGALADEPARKRFRREALVLAKLNHPNIETVHEFGNEGGIDFLVTEYIPGVTLDAKLSAGPLPEKQVVELGIQLGRRDSSSTPQGAGSPRPEACQPACYFRRPFETSGFRASKPGPTRSRARSYSNTDRVPGNYWYLALHGS